ncbi:alpha/beta hydrolase [Cellulomonas chitinilytica]|uniref:Alpha/beta hydrolase n=1 Tax=Cellulomonas chitinilytica TaxID=398759 RepID=A0A919P691_9CELL|nr:alpha/beta hydrolase [Cellulomonas chitinilytica]GIG22723.1 alpha/beta hydrolase [Cellulomonas chitinilytica]
MSDKPTIVLVHGAFADASGWGGVISRLQAQDFPVYAPANPLRGIAADAAYVRDFLGTVEGPVVLVGHSYGGAVITNAAVGADNVRALVYVAAFALDEGESVAEALALGGDPVDLGPVIVARPFPGAGEGNADGYINPAVFSQAFCQDLPADVAAVMAVSQRPAALSGLGEPSGTPAWKTLPSWYLVGVADHLIPAASARVMAARAGATTVEVDSSHVAMISHPDETTALILAAVDATA